MNSQESIPNEVSQVAVFLKNSGPKTTPLAVFLKNSGPKTTV